MLPKRTVQMPVQVILLAPRRLPDRDRVGGVDSRGPMLRPTDWRLPLCLVTSP